MGRFLWHIQRERVWFARELKCSLHGGCVGSKGKSGTQ